MNPLNRTAASAIILLFFVSGCSQSPAPGSEEEVVINTKQRQFETPPVATADYENSEAVGLDPEVPGTLQDLNTEAPATKTSPLATASGETRQPSVTRSVTAPADSDEAAVAEVHIDYFLAEPTALHAGDVINLAWAASGVTAEICPLSRYTYFTEEDCQFVPLVGSLHFTIPGDMRPEYAPGFRLKVIGTDESDFEESYQYVDLICPSTWFHDSAPVAGSVCPQPAIESQAAIQHFEHGTMVWIESLGRYYIFLANSLSLAPLDQQLPLSQIDDPLTIIGDSSSSFTPPEGFYAPESGFGLIWRGDVSESAPMLDLLGWATAPEFGYQAVFQCSEFASTQIGVTCYMSGPLDELAWIDSGNGRWRRLR